MDAIAFGVKLLLELVPLFVLISTVVYLVVDRLTPARLSALLGRGSRWTTVAVAAGAGALTPFCSCSTVPVINGMKVARIPVAAMMAFLVASPLISPVALVLLGTAIGLEYAILYAASGLVFAVGAGFVVEWWYGSATMEVAGSAGPPPRLAREARPACGSAVGVSMPQTSSMLRTSCMPLRTGGIVASGGALAMDAPGACGPLVLPSTFRAALAVAFRRALKDLRTLWIPLVLAAAVGAAIHGYVPADLLSAVAGSGQLWAIPAAALLGVPIYASVVVLLPLGSTLLAKGVGVGALTAFLMGASGFSVPEGMLLSRILPLPLLGRVLAVFAAGVILIGFLFEWLVG